MHKIDRPRILGRLENQLWPEAIHLLVLRNDN